MKKLTAGVLMIGVGALAAFGGYRYAMHRVMTADSPAAAATASPETKPLYYHDPMFPQQRFDKPGKSPFMDMQLVPVYAGAAGEESKVSISPQVVQNLGIRTAEARMGTLEPKLEAVGSVGWNERGVALVQTRSAGFVEKLYARAPLDPVTKGAPLVEIFFPEWAGAQEEFLLLRRQSSEDSKALAAAARQRLVLLGMSEDEIGQVERDGKVIARFTLRSPISGVIAELGVREGMTVTAGAALFRIIDLSTVWVNVEVPEAQAAWLVPGTRAEARVAAYPDQAFAGRVGAILPEVNPVTRTLKARIELANPGARLKPGMFATVSLSSGRAAQAVLVPSEAVIRTGERSVVVLADGEGKFRPQEVELGIEMGGSSEIRKGLKAGDKVVLSGQFLIDSEASLKSGLGRMESTTPPPKPGATHSGRGKVTEVDAGTGRVEIDHEPIASIKWPRMQMGFTVKDKAQLSGLKPGAAVEFEMRAVPGKDGDYILETIRRAP